MYLLLFVITAVVLCFEGILGQGKHDYLKGNHYQACFVKGAARDIYDEGDDIELNGFVYRCLGRMVKGPTGCLGDNLAKYHIGEIFIEGRFQYKCDENNTAVFKQPLGCTTGEGSTEVVKVGETFDNNGFRYKCIDGGYSTIGCVSNNDGQAVFHPIGHEFLTKTIKLKGHKDLSLEIMGNCEETKTDFHFTLTSDCKLYKNQDLIEEMKWGCSKAIQLNGQEKILHCGSKVSGIDNVAVADKQKNEILGCINVYA